MDLHRHNSFQPMAKAWYTLQLCLRQHILLLVIWLNLFSDRWVSSCHSVIFHQCHQCWNILCHCDSRSHRFWAYNNLSLLNRRQYEFLRVDSVDRCTGSHLRKDSIRSSSITNECFKVRRETFIPINKPHLTMFHQTANYVRFSCFKVVLYRTTGTGFRQCIRLSDWCNANMYKLLHVEVECWATAKYNLNVATEYSCNIFEN